MGKDYEKVRVARKYVEKRNNLYLGLNDHMNRIVGVYDFTGINEIEIWSLMYRVFNKCVDSYPEDMEMCFPEYLHKSFKLNIYKYLDERILPQDRVEIIDKYFIYNRRCNGEVRDPREMLKKMDVFISRMNWELEPEQYEKLMKKSEMILEIIAPMISGEADVDDLGSTLFKGILDTYFERDNVLLPIMEKKINAFRNREQKKLLMKNRKASLKVDKQ